MGQSKRTRAEWEGLIAAWQASGLTQSAWCESNGVNYHTFLDRARRMRRASEGSSQPHQWVEAQVTAEVLGGAAPIQIELGSFRVVVPTDFDEAALVRVCKVLVGL